MSIIYIIYINNLIRNAGEISPRPEKSKKSTCRLEEFYYLCVPFTKGVN